MIYHLNNIFTFIGGIGMFLYGMNIMSNGLQKVAGDKFGNIVKTFTKNKFYAIAIGALITALIQSSSATTVMVVSFVNAGVMKLSEAVGVIMGANIGTTITAWLISITQLGDIMAVLKVDFFAPLVIGLAALMVVFCRKEKTKNKANIFVGLGLLFIGLTFMSKGMSAYSKSEVFVNAFKTLSTNPILAILVGAIVTAIIQSSSASVSILQTLAISGSVSKSAACFITIGQNIGTCITAIISSAGGTKNGKRAAFIHLLFNVLGGLIFTIIILCVYPLIGDYLSTSISVVEISIFHTGFNLLNTLILFPFSSLLVSLSKKVIPVSGEEEIDYNLSEKTMAILDDRILKQPTFAISQVRQEVIYYAGYVLKNLNRSTDLIVKDNNEVLIKDVIVHEEQIDKTTFILVDFLSKINNLNLSEEQAYEVAHLMSMCNDLERIADHAENIAENAEKILSDEIAFSKNGIEEMNTIINIAKRSVENAILCITEKKEEYINEVRECENKVDELEEIYRDNHIKRMGNGECSTIAGIVFLDIIANLERVTDHANNLADYIENELNRKKHSVTNA